MAINRVLNYVVGTDGKVTCDGTRRPQVVGVQGDDGVCKLNFDLSAVYSENSHYFFEIVCGQRTPLLLSDESDGVTFEDKTLSLVLSSDITAEGGRVEISIVEEVIDEENVTVSDGSTYTTYIKLESKDGVIRRIRETAYGIFLDCKKMFEQSLKSALLTYEEAKTSQNSAKATYEAVAGDIQENKAGIEGINTDISRINSDLSGHSQSISEHSDKLDALENRDNEHEVSTEAHNDIRLIIKELQTKVNTLLDSDDTTLDQMSEIVAYIKANKSLIDSITTSKVNVDDIIDNLTTNVSNKPLSAAQGVMLKSLIDNLKVPTKTSELLDDVGFAKSEELEKKADNFDVTPDEALEFVELDGKKYIRIKSGNEIIQNNNGLTINTGFGLTIQDGALLVDVNKIKQAENKFKIIQEELETTEEVQVFEFTDLNLTNALIFLTIPEASENQSGYIRINGSNQNSSKNTQIGFLYNIITTAENKVVIELEKQHGIIKGDWTINKTSTGYGTLNRGLKSEQFRQDDENITNIWILVSSTNGYFPIGTKIFILGVEA